MHPHVHVFLFLAKALYYVRWLLPLSWQEASARIYFENELKVHALDGDTATRSATLLQLMHKHHALATTRNRALVAQMRLLSFAAQHHQGVQRREEAVHWWEGTVQTAEKIADQAIRAETVRVLLARAFVQTGGWENFDSKIQKMGAEERLSVARLMLEFEPERLMWLAFALRCCPGQRAKMEELMLMQQSLFIKRHQNVAREMGWWQQRTDLEQLTATSVDRLCKLRGNFLKLADFQPDAPSVYDEAVRQGAVALARTWTATTRRTDEAEELITVATNR